MITNALLKFARAVVEHVMSQLTQQVRIVTDQAISPMQMMVQQVTGGIWRGRGADAFVQAVNGMLVPNTNQMTGAINQLNNNIRFAMDRIEQADVKAGAQFKQLGDVFGKVF